MVNVLRAVGLSVMLTVLGWIGPAHAGLVMGAASLTDALQSAGEAFEKETGSTLTFSFAGSAVIARQVAQGAPAGVVALADAAWMDYLVTQSAVEEGTVVLLASNELVLVTPAGDAAPLALTPEAIAARLGAGRFAIAEPETIPAGRYGKQALETLGLWSKVSARLAPMEHVRVALASIARGEVPLGLVYATDAQVEPRVAVVARIPATAHKPIEIPMALTPQADETARAFYAYLQTPTGQAVLARYGFKVSGL